MVPKLKSMRQDAAWEALSSDETPAARAPWNVTSGGAAIESPARRLQLELEQSWTPADRPRWSARRALSFVVLTNLILWAGLVATAGAIF